MNYDSIAREALISRLMDAVAEGLVVFVVLANVETPYWLSNPVSSGGVLSFDMLNGNKMRVLESQIVAIIEQPEAD